MVALLALTAGVNWAGIRWGLPSRAEDRFLFGELRESWPANRIAELADTKKSPDANLASDVDANPLDRSQMVLVNATDAQRAEIIRRYRLFTYQPDEMQTLMALAAMKPSEGQLDPKTYKYGGLWIYPIGAMLKAASLMEWVELKSDLAFYIDNPNEFGKFYVVARAYTMFWTLIGVWAVWRITLRLSPSPLGGEGRGEGKDVQTLNGVIRSIDETASTPHPNPLPQGERGPEPDLLAAVAAGLCFIFMPVVITMSHEAKPHLPGAVLVLLTALAAMRYLDHGKRAWLYVAGALAGAAAGMVPSAVVAFFVLVAIGAIRREFSHTLIAGVVGVAVYFLTNPYVAINLVVNRELLASNFGNTAEFYDEFGIDAIPNAARLARMGMSSPLAIAGVIGTAAVAILTVRRKDSALRVRMIWLIALPAIASGILFLVFATDQPPDYARFALTLDIALMLAAIVAITTLLKARIMRAIALLFLILTTAISGGMALRGFVRDSAPLTSRLRAAREIENFKALGARRLVVFDEPAPYCLPPVDLFHWQIVLMPKNPDPAMIEGGDVVVYVNHGDLDGTPISWADKRFLISPTQMFLGN